MREGLIAGAVASVVSGAPSTIYALVTRRSPLEATLAAGSMVAPRASKPVRVLVAIPVHLALSLGWGVVLSRLRPRGSGALWGTAAGVGIAALDLGIVGRLWPEIRALQPGPQIADHLAYGATVGSVLHHLEGKDQET